MRLQNLQNPPNAGAAFNLPRPVSLHFISSRPRQQQQRSCGAVALFGFGRSSPSDGGSSGGGAPSTSSTLPSAATTSSVQLPRTAAAQVEQAAAAVQAAHATGVMGGAQVGALAWLGFVATTSLADVTWAKRPFALWLVNNGVHLIGLTLMGGMLAVWR